MQGECVFQSLSFYGIEKVNKMLLLLKNSMWIRYYVLEFTKFSKKKKNYKREKWFVKRQFIYVIFMSLKKKKFFMFSFEKHQIDSFQCFTCYGGVCVLLLSVLKEPQDCLVRYFYFILCN